MTVSRRVTLGWIAAATASPWLADAQTLAPEVMPRSTQAVTWKELDTAITAPGYGTDPDLVKGVVPWPLTLGEKQRGDLRTIAGLMLPGDDRSPSAATLPIDAFIDEWVSAPYPQQQRDRHIILSGLAWLDAESQAHFAKDFAAIADDQRRMLFDLVAWRGKIAPGYDRAAVFFTRLRGLVMAGFYSLPPGFGDIGYVGSTPSAVPYPGPPAEALAHFRAAMERLGLKS